MRNIIKLAAFALSFVALFSCSDNEEYYEQYLSDIKYSSKISNLQGQVGVEKVFLNWTNPNDKVAERIHIEYGEGKVFETEDMVSECVIDGLDSGAGYNFDVYTLDRYGNKSVGSSIYLLPVTREYVDNFVSKVTTVQPVFTLQDGTLTATWPALDGNTFLRYAGEMSYSYTIDGATVTGENNSGDASSETLIIPGIDKPVKVKLDYTMQYYPIISGKVINDIVEITEQQEVEIVFSDEKIYAQIGADQYGRVTTIPYDHIGDFNDSNYAFWHLFDGSQDANWGCWVCVAGNPYNGGAWPISLTFDLSKSRAVSSIEVWGWEGFNAYPREFKVWGANEIASDKPDSYWDITNPGEWQNDWTLLADVTVPDDVQQPGYKGDINPEAISVRYVRIQIFSVFNHPAWQPAPFVGIGELIFKEQLPPGLIIKK